MWEKVRIETEEGAREAVAPLILSASRATDLPAFHLDGFLRRWNEGCLSWRNPFNGKEALVALSKVRAVVFWSKNPRPLLERLDEVKRCGVAFYLQYTLNDYEREGLEPQIPRLEERLATFEALSKRLGRERVIWRFDPLILVDPLRPEDLLARIESLGERLRPYTEKLVFSFADVERYRKVRRRLAGAGFRHRDFTDAEAHHLACGIASLCRRWGVTAATCAEKIDLERYGIMHNRCIDGELLLRIAPDDPILRDFLAGPSPGGQRGFFGEIPGERLERLKDRGQRPECRCIRSKDIGAYGSCRHGCLYCYAR